MSMVSPPRHQIPKPRPWHKPKAVIVRQVCRQTRVPAIPLRQSLLDRRKVLPSSLAAQVADQKADSSEYHEQRRGRGLSECFHVSSVEQNRCRQGKQNHCRECKHYSKDASKFQSDFSSLIAVFRDQSICHPLSAIPYRPRPKNLLML